MRLAKSTKGAERKKQAMENKFHKLDQFLKPAIVNVSETMIKNAIFTKESF